MKVLILEDNEDRNVIFRKNLNGVDISITDDVKELKNLLSSSKWDVLFLDHDLGDEINVSTDREDTGSEVARWLSENPDKIPDIVILHSMNEDGRKNMKRLIPTSVSWPFAWIQTTPSILDQCKDQIHQSAKDQQQRLELYGQL